MYYANFHVEFTITFSTRWFENTNTCTRDVEDKRDGSGGLGEGVEDGRTFSVCGFLCYRIALYIFMVEKGKHKEIHMQMQSHLFMYSWSSIHMHRRIRGIDQFNLIFCSCLLFSFPWLLPRPTRPHTCPSLLRWAHSSGNERKRHSRVMGRWGNLFPFVFIARHFPFFKANNKEKLDSFLASIWRPRRVGREGECVGRACKACFINFTFHSYSLVCFSFRLRRKKFARNKTQNLSKCPVFTVSTAVKWEVEEIFMSHVKKYVDSLNNGLMMGTWMVRLVSTTEVNAEETAVLRDDWRMEIASTWSWMHGVVWCGNGNRRIPAQTSQSLSEMTF